MDDYRKKVGFESYSVAAMVKNSANVHVFNDNYFFDNILHMDPKTVFSADGGTDHRPAGIGNE